MSVYGNCFGVRGGGDGWSGRSSALSLLPKPRSTLLLRLSLLLLPSKRLSVNCSAFVSANRASPKSAPLFISSLCSGHSLGNSSTSSTTLLGRAIKSKRRRSIREMAFSELHSTLADEHKEVSRATVMDVAVIGAGAAGLAMARVLTRLSEPCRSFVEDAESKTDKHSGSGGLKSRVVGTVTVFEKDDDVGGVWRYQPSSSSGDDEISRPMYGGLRTNLPREIMAYREKPWGGDGKGKSFVTHKDVRHYLSSYATDFDLRRHIRFGSVVTHLTVGKGTKEVENGDTVVRSGNEASLHSAYDEADSDTHSSQQEDPSDWQKITLTWEEKVTPSSSGIIESNDVIPKEVVKRTRTFDAVCVCNGHYAKPAPPTISGLDRYFDGRGRKVMHSIDYDDPSPFDGLTVLCVGGRASGSDIAREVSTVAHRVYLSDSKCRTLVMEGETFPSSHICGNVWWVPRTERVTECSIEFEGGFSVPVDDVDVIILCCGYDYAFPFINDKSNLDLKFLEGERRVSPLYHQLWHPRYPSLAFLGLPHSILPFPLFEFQAEAISTQLGLGTRAGISSGTPTLPPLKERLIAAEKDRIGFGPKGPGRVQDTHYLGDYQWDYCRTMAKLSGLYNDQIEDYIATNKAIYDHTGAKRKSACPGGPDNYRDTRYVRNDEQQSFESFDVQNEVIDEENEESERNAATGSREQCALNVALEARDKREKEEEVTKATTAGITCSELKSPSE